MKISEKIYNKYEVAIFGKTTSQFGGLSNMAPNYSLFVNEINIANTEILYQCCRFPLFPKIQEQLIALSNPMEAKALSRKYIQYSRQDWDFVKYDVMKWCLKIKLLQNYESFSKLLLSTGNKTIVEYSLKDTTWGASPFGDNMLKGKNALGRLLTEIREIEVKNNLLSNKVPPLDIPAFLLFNNPIKSVHNVDFVIDDFYDDAY